MKKVKHEKIQDIRQYGIDITEQLESILSEEIAKSIDSQIIKDLMRGSTRIDKIKKIKDKIQQMKNQSI